MSGLNCDVVAANLANAANKTTLRKGTELILQKVADMEEKVK